MKVPNRSHRAEEYDITELTTTAKALEELNSRLDGGKKRICECKERDSGPYPIRPKEKTHLLDAGSRSVSNKMEPKGLIPRHVIIKEAETCP